ncbi:unnamed protein product, partial [Ectocarpus sp. 6 AP-2014]
HLRQLRAPRNNTTDRGTRRRNQPRYCAPAICPTAKGERGVRISVGTKGWQLESTRHQVQYTFAVFRSGRKAKGHPLDRGLGKAGERERGGSRGRGTRWKAGSMQVPPADVLVERLRGRENNTRLVSSSYLCNQKFQAFLTLVLPDLEKSGPRTRDPAKEKKVREAAEGAIKEIRTYGFELRKAEAIEKTSERDIEDYSNQRDQIEESIKGVQEEIGALKEGLVVERKKRHNKEVYEETCKDINKYPPHRATKATFGYMSAAVFMVLQLAIEKLEQELVLLHERRKAVQAVQKLKHKQIALLLQSLTDIQATVEEGEVEEEPTVGALELIGLDEELVVDGTAEEGDGDNGDGEEGDDDGNDDDGEAEEEGERRRGRKRSPSAESDEVERVAVGANGGPAPVMPGVLGGLGSRKGVHSSTLSKRRNRKSIPVSSEIDPCNCFICGI